MHMKKRARVSMGQILSARSSQLQQEEIVSRFRSGLRGVKFEPDASIRRQQCHHGEKGHFAERSMGIRPNCANAPDLLGYEQKKVSGKITFGDWRPTWYLYEKNHPHMTTRSDFIKTFGEKNPKKHNRWSWSGKVFPTYGEKYNYSGQRMLYDEDGNLTVQYSQHMDTRDSAATFPHEGDHIVIAMWSREKLKNHVEKKFGVRGFYLIDKDASSGVYSSISFGDAISYDDFEARMREGVIFVDSGMYLGNPRCYSLFRASKRFWLTRTTCKFV